MSKRGLAGFAPIVIDLETGGVDAATDALLEIAAFEVKQEPVHGKWVMGESFHRHITPHPRLRCTPEALAITGIIPDQPLRAGVAEDVMLADLADFIQGCCKRARVHRGILVGHNAHFDLGFLTAALKRSGQKLPMHRFTCLDTATLGAVLERESVLARLLPKAQMRYRKDKAHSAIYDADITAKLFCHWLNRLDA